MQCLSVTWEKSDNSFGWSKIRTFVDFLRGLEGIDDCGELLLLFWFNKCAG